MALEDSNWASNDGEWSFTGSLDNFSRFVIHNEGQIVPVMNKEGVASGYSVQLAQLTYQNTAVPILTLKLLEDASGKTSTYSWAETGAEKIGFNARWAQAGLTQKAGNPSFGFEVSDAGAADPDKD